MGAISHAYFTCACWHEPSLHRAGTRDISNESNTDPTPDFTPPSPLRDIELFSITSANSGIRVVKKVVRGLIAENMLRFTPMS